VTEDSVSTRVGHMIKTKVKEVSFYGLRQYALQSFHNLCHSSFKLECCRSVFPPKSFDKKYHLLEEKFQTLECATEI